MVAPEGRQKHGFLFLIRLVSRVHEDKIVCFCIPLTCKAFFNASDFRNVCSSLPPPLVAARPLVRNIKDQREFDKLLKHHATTTGLPVVADFFSESCGPCRMMAPIFKAVAKENEGKAVFVKVDTARNRQLQANYNVRSIPTFLFFGADGKKKKEFAGAGEQQLRAYTREIVRDAERLNVRLSLESLTAFYAAHDSSKNPESIAELHAKCSKMAKSRHCEGGAASDLAAKLRKKYRAKPELLPRIGNDDHEEHPRASQSSSPERRDSSRARRTTAAVEEKANLHLASLEELQAAVVQRRAEMGVVDDDDDEAVSFRDDEEDDDDEDDEDDDDIKPMWQSRGVPERVAIIGSGPAGLAAAVYAARAGLSPVVVAPPFGGQLMGKGVDVENYPGLLEQTGPGVVNLMLKQAASFGTVFEEQLVTNLDLSRRPFVLECGNGSSVIEAHAIIVATGADSKWLGVKGEYEFRGGGVSTCATCDGFLFRDKAVVVVGGGDTAMEDALVLARTSSKVTVVHRRGTFRASHALAQRVLGHEKIEVLWHSRVDEFLGELPHGNEDDDDYRPWPKLTGVRVVTTDPLTGESNLGVVLQVAAAFVAIGHEPNTQLFRGTDVAMRDDGYLLTFNGSTSTSVEGVYAAGDVADHVYRQAITSAGSGAMASLDAERWLSSNGLGETETVLSSTIPSTKNASSKGKDVNEEDDKDDDEDLIRWAMGSGGSEL